MIPPICNTKKISTSDLCNIRFKASSNGLSADETRGNRNNLNLSVLLGSRAEAIVKIVFNTIHGYHEIMAPVWGATNKYILLTNGSFIPMESVAAITLD